MKFKRPVPLFLFTMFFISICSCSSSKKEQNPQTFCSYNDVTAGIRSRENASALFVEQRFNLDNGKFCIIPTYASRKLLIKNPKNRSEELENILISIANDQSSLYIYNPATVRRFLSSEISGEQLKYLLSVEGMDSEGILHKEELNKLFRQALQSVQLLKKRHKQNAILAAELLEVFVSDGCWMDPEKLDADYFSKINQGPLLAQTGIPYRRIKQKQLEALKKSGYPLYNFLLKEGVGKVVNKLPNCAQGATQLSYGFSVYTKVSQFYKDAKKFYLPVTKTKDVQAGDMFYQVWNMDADSTTNSGHMGTILDIIYTNSGQIKDMLLLEFYPGNSAPIIILLSRSIYSIASIQNLENIPDGPWGIKRLNIRDEENRFYDRKAIEMFLNVFLEKLHSD